MNRAIRKLLLFSLLALCLFIFVGCGRADLELNGGTLDGDTEKVSIKEAIELVPEKEGYIFGGWYSDKEMTELVTKETKGLYKIKALYAKWITADVKLYAVRGDTVKITDSGRKNQQLDIAYLSKDYDYQGLKFAGYKELKIEFSFSMYEKDDGYQYVFFYSDTSCVNTSSIDYFISNTLLGKDESDPSLLCSHRFEHVPGKADDNMQRYDFTAYVSLDDLKDDLYIRYGASGNWDDDWYCGNVILRVTPVK